MAMGPYKPKRIMQFRYPTQARIFPIKNKGISVAGLAVDGEQLKLEATWLLFGRFDGRLKFLGVKLG